MRKPRKVKRAIESINKLFQFIEFYTTGRPDVNRQLMKDMKELTETIVELAEDEETHDLELKKQWDKEHETK